MENNRISGTTVYYAKENHDWIPEREWLFKLLVDRNGTVMKDNIDPFDKLIKYLSASLKRPFNIGVIKENKDSVEKTGRVYPNGIVEYYIETVYTPFKPEDIQVQVIEDVIEVSIKHMGEPDDKCDSKQEVPATVKEELYHGISQQEPSFKLKIKDIDADGISVVARDGILKISLPVKPECAKQIKTVKINN